MNKICDNCETAIHCAKYGCIPERISSKPAQQEPVLCCGKYETCTQACTPRGRFLGKREALAEQPAQQEPVARVDANDEGYWADILPDRTVKVGQLLYAEAPQPAQQEPVAWIVEDQSGERLEWASDAHSCHGVPTFPLYTSPPAQRTWVGLADEEKRQLFDREDYQGWLDYINAIEAKLRSKNEDRN